MGVLSEERVIRVMIIVNLLILSAGYIKEGAERIWGLKRGQGGRGAMREKGGNNGGRR